VKNDVFPILMVEDDPGDKKLAEIAFTKAKITNPLTIVPSAEEGLKYLRREGEYSDVEPPEVLLLDLNLPGMNGHQMLAEIRRDPKLHNLVVIIMTASDADTDIQRAYSENANAFVTKPVGLASLVEVFEAFDSFWVGWVKRDAA